MMNRRQWLAGTGALALAPVGLSTYAVAVEPMLAPRVTRYALTPPHWPETLSLRIGVIADIHACEPWMSAERIHSIALSVNALQPDLIVLLGDFNAGHDYVTAAVQPEAWAEALSVLRAPLGVYSILGNHDWFHGALPQLPRNVGDIRRALHRVGIPVLENTSLRLSKGEQSFWLAGLADQMIHLMSDQWTEGGQDIATTVQQARGDAPILLMMHEPYLFPFVPDRVSLTLCGHTHGGQVKLPVLGTPFSWSRHYVYGHMVEGGRHMIISGGLGESGAPIRFDVPPEVLQIDLGAAPRPV